jgi:Sec-independent protein translocase protein TatA
MRGLGGGVKEFKKAMREEDDDKTKDDSKKLS